MALRAHNGNANGRHEPYARPSSALPSGALAAVPTVDLGAGVVVIDPPEDVGEPEE